MAKTGSYLIIALFIFLAVSVFFNWSSCNQLNRIKSDRIDELEQIRDSAQRKIDSLYNLTVLRDSANAMLNKQIMAIQDSISVIHSENLQIKKRYEKRFRAIGDASVDELQRILAEQMAKDTVD